MPPKKGKKMALNDFLVDDTLGSWADDMDGLPTAPTVKTDDDRFGGGDRRRDFSSRDRDFAPRESNFPPRAELPLPTQPPYMAFVGNLSFDIYEDAIAEFFAPSATKSIKIIKDRDEKPKGFGYVEFETLDGLKDGLSRSGGQLAGRTVRVSVAEPPKERAGGFDDDRFEGPWRRQGPLPPLAGPGPSEPRRPSAGFVPRDSNGEPPAPSAADNSNDWRSNRRGPLPPPPERQPSGSRKTSAAPDPEHPAFTEQSWGMGSKFKPSEPPSPGPSGPGVERERRGLFGGKGTDAAAPASAADGSSDWRSGPRRVTSQGGSLRGSPTSTPPTPQRKKLELLPRGAGSPAAESPSPLSSPRMATANVNKPSPFGAAKPIDASNREKEVEEKIEQDRARTAAAAKEKESQPRSGFSRASNPNSPLPTTARSLAVSPRSTPNSLPPSQVTSPTSTAPPTPAAKKEFAANAGAIRPKFSFAAAAGKTGKADEEATAGDAEVTQVADQVAEVTL